MIICTKTWRSALTLGVQTLECVLTLGKIRTLGARAQQRASNTRALFVTR